MMIIKLIMKSLHGVKIVFSLHMEKPEGISLTR